VLRNFNLDFEALNFGAKICAHGDFESTHQGELRLGVFEAIGDGQKSAVNGDQSG